MFSGRVKVKILLLADFLKGPFDSWCCQVDFEFEVKGCSLGYIIYPIMILRIFSYNVKTFLFFCCGLLVAQTTHVMIQIIDAQSCEKSIFFCVLFLGGYTYIYICTWCYLLWSISSPCPLSLPNPPPYDALIDRNRGVFPKKGLVCSPRNVMPRTRGMCGFFFGSFSTWKKNTSS